MNSFFFFVSLDRYPMTALNGFLKYTYVSYNWVQIIFMQISRQTTCSKHSWNEKKKAFGLFSANSCYSKPVYPNKRAKIKCTSRKINHCKPLKHSCHFLLNYYRGHWQHQVNKSFFLFVFFFLFYGTKYYVPQNYAVYRTMIYGKDYRKN